MAVQIMQASLNFLRSTGDHMTHDEVLAKLQVIFDQLFLVPVRLSATLVASEVQEWDSLMHINIVIATEKAFGVRFHLGDVEKTKNVGEFVDLVLKYRQGQ